MNSISINFETPEALAAFIEKILLDESFEGEIVEDEVTEDAEEVKLPVEEGAAAEVVEA